MMVGEREVQAWVHRGTDAVRAENASRKGPLDARAQRRMARELAARMQRGRETKIPAQSAAPRERHSLGAKHGGASAGC